MDVFDKRQIRIAKDTLQTSDAMLGVMGGMTKDQARDILARLAGWTIAQIREFEGN